ncbi:MAG: 30S ribosomal protein S4 [Methanomassiliicoccales archaeon]|jgi:small subunit ribosomal protein S4|nr:30S ribosomal protein S4 [Methanomassiliicoccales archaeon]
MGDPKFPRRTYDTPSHPWKADRIKEETELVRIYGLKNKREIWKAKSIVRNLRRQSRNLQARLRYGEEQARIETQNLLRKCGMIGLLPLDGSTLDDVLSLTAESILNRRLQTLVYKKGLANTMEQARQFIVHGHIFVNGRKVTVPGYIVGRNEEDKIEFNPASPLADEQHPMRLLKKKSKEERGVEKVALEKPKVPKKILKVKEVVEVLEEGGEAFEELDIDEGDTETEEAK